MKFDCGPTPSEKLLALAEWHRVFAWFPIDLGPHDCRWLEFVERRIKPDTPRLVAVRAYELFEQRDQAAVTWECMWGSLDSDDFEYRAIQPEGPDK